MLISIPFIVMFVLAIILFTQFATPYGTLWFILLTLAIALFSQNAILHGSRSAGPR